ncbi:hypothetical protein CSIM01_09327 [Colletotrichum simmondsii]|uniref:Uncharacterized protein n=1 Tax=Colletotrichum simmondsii TaxID=703756 RepID=A0A135TFV7_9PEZI|nr:hypothetical protein CSIM01_09327 [Colletotrichum simmondsii]
MPLFATFLAVSLVSLYTAGFATIITYDNNEKQTSKPEEEVTEELLEKREDENEVLDEKRREDISPEVLRNPDPFLLFLKLEKSPLR